MYFTQNSKFILTLFYKLEQNKKNLFKGGDLFFFFLILEKFNKQHIFHIDTIINFLSCYMQNFKHSYLTVKRRLCINKLVSRLF